MQDTFLVLNEFTVVNVNRIIMITLNKDGKWGWVHVDRMDNKVARYKISPQKYIEVVRLVIERIKK